MSVDSSTILSSFSPSSSRHAEYLFPCFASRQGCFEKYIQTAYLSSASFFPLLRVSKSLERLRWSSSSVDTLNSSWAISSRILMVKSNCACRDFTCPSCCFIVCCNRSMATEEDREDICCAGAEAYHNQQASIPPSWNSFPRETRTSSSELADSCDDEARISFCVSVFTRDISFSFSSMHTLLSCSRAFWCLI